VPAPEEPVTEMIGWATEHINSETGHGARRAASARRSDAARDGSDPGAPPLRAIRTGAGCADAVSGAARRECACGRWRRAARLFDEPGDGIGFIDQAQATLAVAVSNVGRIQIDAAAREHAVRFGDHGGNPAHIEVGAPRPLGALQAIIHVDADRLVPVAMIRCIDRKLLRSRGHADML